MGDPLSVAASIAGLVTLADVVFTKAYRYVRAAKKASSEIVAFSSELGSLHGILCSIRSISVQLESEVFESTTRLHHVHACQKTLEEVQKILDRDKNLSSDAPWNRVKQSLRWPFKASEVKALVSDIERHKATLGLALEVDGIVGLMQVLSGQKNLQSTVDGIENEMRLKREIDTRVVLDEQDSKILGTFGRIDHRRSHDMNRMLRHPGTGIWLIESPAFEQWLQSQNETLWLYGIPGAGKTILASLAIDQLIPRSTPEHAVAYFYCDYQDPKTYEPSSILGSLVQQISKQNEQSFDHVRDFYKSNGHERQDLVFYEASLLVKLLIDMMSHFESTTIAVDALDECLGHVSEVVELLTSIHRNSAGIDVKFLLFSRDEVDIRHHLGNEPQISIAAENADLKLYVGAEIEERIRKNKLHIKSPSLKEFIVERLISGAEGMFRWVACQIDHLCNLPHDAARRKALHNLPLGLKPTYERILRNINSNDEETQRVAQRVFRWLSIKRRNLTIPALCQAVAIDLTDTCIDVEALPDEGMILRLCSSLIRRSPSGDSLEFAHFTVKEFLSQLTNTTDQEFAAFALNPAAVEQEIAKVCLTYINMPDFDRLEDLTEEAHVILKEQHPFRLLANNQWPDLVLDWRDTELVRLIKRLFDPVKTGQFIAWAQAYSLNILQGDYVDDDTVKADIKVVNAACKSTTTLHFAAMLGMADICEWLVELGSDVNRSSAIGSPLQCAIVTSKSSYNFVSDDRRFIHITRSDRDKDQLATVERLLAKGADPNMYLVKGDTQTSTMELALDSDNSIEIAVRLLHAGSAIGSDEFEKLGEVCEDELTQESIASLTQLMSETRCFDELQELVLKKKILHAAEDGINTSEVLFLNLEKSRNGTQVDMARIEASLRLAAEYGHVESVTKLLSQYTVNVDAVAKGTGKTAIHLAAEGDHLPVIEALVVHGADPTVIDYAGWSALRHSITAPGTSCLDFLLDYHFDMNAPDKKGTTMWYQTISSNNVQGLKMILGRKKVLWRPSDEARDAMKFRSPLLYAARKVGVEFLPLLMEAGCSVQDVDNKGRSALHHAAKTSSVEKIKFLIEHGASIPAISNNGSSALHSAASSRQKSQDEAMALLMTHGLDPLLARHDTLTPIDLYVNGCHGGEDITTKSATLRLLLGFKQPHSTVQHCLSQTLLKLCRLPDKYQVPWSSTAVASLLETEGGLATTDDSGRTLTSILLGSWLEYCQRPEFHDFDTVQDLLFKPTRTICVILKNMTKDTLSEKADSLSIALILALWFGDQDLAWEVLRFSPDVDRNTLIGQRSFRATSFVGLESCSDTLSMEIVVRSRGLTDAAVALRLWNRVANAGNCRAANILLRAGINLEHHDTKGETPLMKAVQSREVEMVQLLIGAGAPVESKDENGWNAAHYACKAGNIHIFRYLRNTAIDWSAGVRLETKYEVLYDVTVTHIAARYGKTYILEILHSEGLIDDLDCTTSGGHTPLFLAVIYGHLATVAWLLDHNARTNIMPPYWGESALHLCVRDGRKAMYALFEEHKCDLEAVNAEGLTCEMIALQNNQKQLAERIARAREKIESLEASKIPVKRSIQALKLAIELGDVDLCKSAYDDGADLNSILPQTRGMTPISYCASENQSRIAMFLLENGVTDIRTAGTLNIFHNAIAWNNSKMLKLLLEKHETILFNTRAPLHPIHLAVAGKRVECVKLLLSHQYQYCTRDAAFLKQETGQPGSSTSLTHKMSPVAQYLLNLPVGDLSNEPFLENFYEEDEELDQYMKSFTCLHLAVNAQNKALVQEIVSAGGPINAVTSQMQTALHLACEKGNLPIAQLLLSAGADQYALDDALRTPAMVAAHEGQSHVLEPLLRAGLDIEACDSFERSIAHLAARCLATKPLACVINYARGSVDLKKLNSDHENVLFTAYSYTEDPSFLLNLAPEPEAYKPGQDNILNAAIKNGDMSWRHIKMLLKRIPAEYLQQNLCHGALHRGTPLFVACAQLPAFRQARVVPLLLDFGAPIDQDCGRYGSPLMAACSTGRLEAVRILIERGAHTTFIKEGKLMSPLDAARRYPDIVEWLITGRYKERPLRLTWDRYRSEKDRGKAVASSRRQLSYRHGRA